MGSYIWEVDKVATEKRAIGMNVTFFIGSLYGGGAERVICNLASYLVQKGHKVEILTMSETKESYDLDERVTTKSLLSLNNRKNKIWNVLIRFPRLWKYMRKTENDIYVVMLPKTTVMFLAFRWMTKAKVVAAERVDPAAYSNTIGCLLKRYAHRADGFVFQTEDAKAWYGDAVKDCKTVIIPNAINPVFIRKPYTGEKRKVITGAGRLCEQKNFSLLIRAFAKISDDFPDYKLVIYGEGEKRDELESLVKELGLESRVAFPGYIQNIADEMEKNSMFVLSSNFEGMPNALMEAMALGLPCISTDCPCGGPRFLIQNGENGLLVPVGNVEKMALAMKKLLGDQDYASRLISAANEIKRRLAPEKIYGKWESFIKSVCEIK
jgi:glycosyltransferase involved in cell wall biosynthesis